ncbi:MAG: 50S ribosomal protein L21 [Solirubrobacterales bacterium]
MYAIVKTGGKQYRVEEGQSLVVERLPDDEGATVTLEPVMYRSDDIVVDPAGLGKVKVQAKVLEHLRGEKIRVFKFKPKRGYKRTQGHRQELTRIEVTGISMGAAARKAPAAKKEPAAKTTAAKPAAKKPAAKKPAAKKPAAGKDS